MKISLKKLPKLILAKPFILGLLWLIVNALLYNKLGIKIVFDSHRYLTYAASVEAGDAYWYQADSVLYSSYTLLLYLILFLLHLPVWFVVFVQITFSGIALFYLYKAVINITNNQKSAFICLLLFILWPEIHQWNFYIHTESLYISATIFLLYGISKHYQSASSILIVLLVVLFASFLRPNGFFLLLGACAGAVSYLYQRYNFRFIHTSTLFMAIATAPLLIYAAKEAIDVYSPIQYLVRGQIIQGYDGLNVNIAAVELDAGTTVLRQWWHVVAAQPYAYAKLLLLRFIFFWGQIRPYYSAPHIFFILLYFIPVYIAALYGVQRFRQHAIKVFILVVTTLQTTMSLVIAVDWDNRFIVPLLPFIFIFAAIGFNSLYTNVSGTKLQ